MQKLSTRCLVMIGWLVTSLSLHAQQWETNGNDIVNTNTGNVGIGISVPKARLHIGNGNILLDNDRYLTTIRADDGFAHQVFGMDGLNSMVLNRSALVHAKPSSTIIGYGGANQFFQVRNQNNQAVFTINDLGYVGVGTNIPQAKFHVSAGNILLDNSRYLAITRADDGFAHQVFGMDSNNDMLFNRSAIVHARPSSTIIGYGGTGQFFQVRNENNQAVFAINDQGNVGIGTGDPTGKLEIKKTLSGGNDPFVAQNIGVDIEEFSGYVGDITGLHINLANGNGFFGNALATGLLVDVSNISGQNAEIKAADFIGGPIKVEGITFADNSTLNSASAISNPNDELITQAILQGTSLEIVEGGNTTVVDLSALQDGISNADTDSTNELNTGFELVGTLLKITDAGGTLIQDLSVLQDGVADADSDSTNELNMGIGLSGTVLEITDGGGTLSQDLSMLQDDADADPSNELQSLAIINDSLFISQGNAVPLNFDNAGDGLGDHVATQNILLNSQWISGDGENEGVYIDGAGNVGIGTNNPSSTLEVSGTAKATAFEGSGALITNINAANINSGVLNEAIIPMLDASVISQGVFDLSQIPDSEYMIDTPGASGEVWTSDGDGKGHWASLPVVTNTDSDSTNEFNIGIGLSGTVLEITDGGGTLSQDLNALQDGVDDADADSTNELNMGIGLSGTVLEITDAGGTLSQDLSVLQDGVDDADSDSTNEFNIGIGLSGTVLEITDGGGTLSQDLSVLQDGVADADSDSTNEFNIGIGLSGTVLEITDGGGTLSQDLSVLQDGVDDADADPMNELQDLQLVANTLSITNNMAATNIDLSSYLDNTDNQNLSSAKNGNTITISIDRGQSTSFSVDDADASASNEIQSLTLNGQTLSISNGNSVTLTDQVNDADASPFNELNQNMWISGTTLYLQDAGGTRSVNLSGLLSGFNEVPTGLIAAFDGPCPSGWSEVTQAAGRFIVGAGSNGGHSYSVGSTGGAAEVTLTVDQIPSHNHALKKGQGGQRTNSILGNNGNSPNIAGQDWANGWVTNQSNIDKLMQKTGGGQAHENRPPYIAYRICKCNGSNLTSGTQEQVVNSKIDEKRNISRLSKALDKIMQLKGVTFETKDNAYEQFELVIDEVEKTLPGLIGKGQTNEGSIHYEGLIPVMVEAIKELKHELDEVKGKLTASQNNVGDQSNEGIIGASKKIGVVLYQNTPNPFSENTEIRYKVPEGSNQAMLYIYNMNGELLKTFRNLSKGDGSVEISGDTFAAGMYLYSLIVDGQEVDTKRMILMD